MLKNLLSLFLPMFKKIGIFLIMTGMVFTTSPFVLVMAETEDSAQSDSTDAVETLQTNTQEHIEDNVEEYVEQQEQSDVSDVQNTEEQTQTDNEEDNSANAQDQSTSTSSQENDKDKDDDQAQADTNNEGGADNQAEDAELYEEATVLQKVDNANLNQDTSTSTSSTVATATSSAQVIAEKSSSTSTQSSAVIDSSEVFASTTAQGPGEDGYDTPDGKNIENADDTDTPSSEKSSSEGGAGASGGATSGDTDPSANIETGDSHAVANIVNVVNTNIVNSEGLLLFLSNLFGDIDLDLRSAFDTFDPGLTSGFGSSNTATSTCALDACLQSSVDFTSVSSSTAQIVNDVVVRSTTGANTASSQLGQAIVNTGDAFAASNVVNVVNTNITDSNYLLISLNNFGDLTGDLVLPGADFFEKFLSRNSAFLNHGIASTSVDNGNEAIVSNNAHVQAMTGENTASSTDSMIDTGTAHSHSHVANKINQNFFNSDSLVIMLRVWGDWSGQMFGAPEGMQWYDNPDGSISLLFADQSITTGDNNSTTPDSKSASDTINNSIGNSNRASIINNMDIMSLTGENYAEGGEGVRISTGEAYAASNILNVANTNIIGSNWILAMIDIFGDWQGDIAFGRPDLWVGSVIETPRSPLEAGDNLVFKFTVANRGDARASDVRLKMFSDWSTLWMDSGEVIDGGRQWDIGDLDAGEVREYTYRGSIRDILSYGDRSFETRIQATSRETDSDNTDNTERLALTVHSDNRSTSRGESIYYTPPSDLVIEKYHNATSSLHASSTLDYTIIIKNEGAGPAYYAELVDILENEQGDIIHEERWVLDTVFAGEEITVTYTTAFSADTLSGMYTNSAQIKAYDGHTSLDPFYASVADSGIIQSSVEVIGAIDQTGVDEDASTGEQVNAGAQDEEQSQATGSEGGSEQVSQDDTSHLDQSATVAGGQGGIGGDASHYQGSTVEQGTVDIIFSEQTREYKEFIAEEAVHGPLDTPAVTGTIVLESIQDESPISQLASSVAGAGLNLPIYLLLGAGLFIVVMYAFSITGIPRFPFF